MTADRHASASFDATSASGRQRMPQHHTPACESLCRAKMVVLNFTLTPEAASKIHDVLVCLGKFSDTVAIEARRERVSHQSPFESLPSSHTPLLSSHSRLSTCQNPHMPPLPLTASNSLPNMSAFRAMAGLTAASPVACTPRPFCQSSRGAFTIH